MHRIVRFATIVSETAKELHLPPHEVRRMILEQSDLSHYHSDYFVLAQSDCIAVTDASREVAHEALRRFNYDADTSLSLHIVQSMADLGWDFTNNHIGSRKFVAFAADVWDMVHDLRAGNLID